MATRCEVFPKNPKLPMRIWTAYTVPTTVPFGVASFLSLHHRIKPHTLNTSFPQRGNCRRKMLESHKQIAIIWISAEGFSLDRYPAPPPFPPLQWPFGRTKFKIIHTVTMRGCKMDHPPLFSHNVTGCPPNSRTAAVGSIPSRLAMSQSPLPSAYACTPPGSRISGFPYSPRWSRLSVIDRMLAVEVATCSARRSTQRKENMGNDHPRQEQHHRKMNLYTNFEVRRQSFGFYNLVVFQWSSQRFGGRRSPRHRWG
jgi:hypothetical protein